MALNKLKLTPDSSSYSVTDGKEVVATQLDGGAARYRRDILGATSTVSVSFILGTVEYSYLRAFYKALVSSGATPFLIDLILDKPELTEHKAYFVPGSIQLTAQKGLTYWVSAQLEVYPVAMTEDDFTFAALYGEFGENWRLLFPPVEDELNTITNVTLPGLMQ